MVTTKAICFEQIVQIWDDGLQTHFNLIPLEQNVKLNVDECDIVEDTTMSRCIVGSLIYMTVIRLNLSYAVGVVNQFM
jgi:hypothetical protein